MADEMEGGRQTSDETAAEPANGRPASTVVLSRDDRRLLLEIVDEMCRGGQTYLYAGAMTSRGAGGPDGALISAADRLLERGPLDDHTFAIVKLAHLNAELMLEAHGPAEQREILSAALQVTPVPPSQMREARVEAALSELWIATEPVRAFTRRALLPVLVCAVVVGAVVAGVQADVPQPVPDWALRQAAVYRAEVAAVVGIALYLGLVAVVLAARGRVFTRFSAAGGSLEAEQLDNTTDAVDQLETAQEQLAAALETAIVDLDKRLRAIEDEA